ncbi:MAG TPA: SIMPL domain-containing protein [Candidatus Paceibacterota bacterium]|nr:SIMPL domain-containing protein [Candidatus Paceibacterota bacterium]
MEKSTLKGPSAVLGGLIALGLIISVAIWAYTFYRIQLFSGSLSVTGSAKTDVVSDQVKWVMGISRQVPQSQLSFGYDQMAADLVLVNKFLASHNVDLNAVTVSPISMDEVYDYGKDTSNTEKRYNLRQTITYSSSDVQGVTAMTKDASNLARNGVIFQTQSLEYYYSKLPDLRVSLLADAIKDAKARAAKLAEPSGQTVGPLKAASLGVVQVLAPNSIEISDYGAYDTSNINKEVMVTVRASFAIR